VGTPTGWSIGVDDQTTADETQAAAAAGDSLTVAAWTAVSRVTGLARFAVIAAVLGATYFGNTYQFTNSLPNLLYYGFLAGSLFSSLLVPALVRHIDAGDWQASERVAGGFLGVTLAAMVAITPLAVVLGPLALKIATIGGPHAVSAAQVHVGRVLIAMFIPQMFCYAVVGTSTAVMNSRRRFALAAGAPAVENLGTIAVLVACALIYGTGNDLGHIPPGEILLLGLGSTGAVAAHAAMQWWGARRAGVLLVPRAGWRDSEVRTVVRRALPALAQAGLAAVQLLILLIAANRLPGGIVAFQIALNFYYLVDALATTPVALSLLPRLARMHADGDLAGFRDTLVRGFALGFFITIPAGVAYVILAGPLARAIAFGRMDATGVAMIAAALVPLSVAVVGWTAFMIATYASYAREDTRSPLRAMMLQTVLCLGLASATLVVHGLTVMVVLGLATAVPVAVAACYLVSRVSRTLGHPMSRRLIPSLGRFAVGAAVMAGPAWLVATAVPRWLAAPLGPRVGIFAAALVGVAIYGSLQALWRTPEVSWLAGGLSHIRGRASRTAVGTVTASGSLLSLAAASGRYRVGAGPANGLFRFPSSRWLIWPTLAGAVGLGVVMSRFPVQALFGLLAFALGACIWKWPVLAAYLAIGLTPLTVGLDSGSVLPLVRPNEALELFAGATLGVRCLTRLRTGQLPRFRLDRVEVAIVAMAVTNSVVPLLWMSVRQEAITTDDLLYALVMWKLLGIYAIVRAAVRTDLEVRRCLWLSVAVGAVVALVAIVQSLSVLGVSQLLSQYYSYAAAGPAGGRGSSTLGLPAATADLLIFNLAIVTGLWTRYRGHRFILAAAGVLFVAGVLAAGEFSSAIGLVVGIICIAVVLRSPRILTIFALVTAVGAYLVRPVISQRLSDFQTGNGLPVSWTGRLYNLETYFWPKLFSDWNFVLGVRPSARVAVASKLGHYVWIESGYTWLLWGGGIPLLASFLFFVYATAWRGWEAARGAYGARSVAGIAVFAAVGVISTLMAFDPHLTYRGSADLFFFLIALTAHRDRSARQPVVSLSERAMTEV
jgi:putative peptidoglycan lipid II flippase